THPKRARGNVTSGMVPSCNQMTRCYRQPSKVRVHQGDAIKMIKAGTNPCCIVHTGGENMYHDDGHQLYMPQDIRLRSVCRNCVELREFRDRTGGGIAPECRECPKSIRAAQR
ncbi:MAG: hypothetical protein L7W43_19055, partial [Rubripirellula sp.]|nr:hypothetical protein [Rubripirellula sp.]